MNIEEKTNKYGVRIEKITTMIMDRLIIRLTYKNLMIEKNFANYGDDVKLASVFLRQHQTPKAMIKYLETKTGHKITIKEKKDVSSTKNLGSKKTSKHTTYARKSTPKNGRRSRTKA